MIGHDHEHQGHVTQDPTALGRACCQDGRHRLPKIILYGELSSGLRNRGAPKKRYKDTLKKSLGACNISHLEWLPSPKTAASHYKQSCLLLRILPEVCHRGKTSEENVRGEKTVQPQHQTLTRPLPAVTATGLVDPAYAWQVTSAPAGNVDFLNLIFVSEAKPWMNEWIWSYYICLNRVETQVL